MPGSVLVVLAYVLLAVFAVAFLFRSVRLARLPVHLRWELAPVPHEKGRDRYGGSYLEEFEWWTKPREKSLLNELVYMFLEIVFLKSVWEHQRRMWWFSFPFHFGMYLLIVTAGLVGLGAALGLSGVPGPGVGLARTGIAVVAGAGYLLGAVGALGLLISRLGDGRLAAFTTPVMLFNLALLLAVFVSGAVALWASPGFAGNTLAFVGAVLSGNLLVTVPAVLAVHLVLALVFLAYLPFTQMMHFVAKYFTYHQVRWNDTPMARGDRMEREVLQRLSQPVTWSAAHVNANGRKNWVQIATEENER